MDTNKHELSDEDYIKELEGFVCFLAKTYEASYKTYVSDHMEKIQHGNPNRRELTEAEQSEWMRFPMIQGSRLQNIVSAFAKSDKPMPKHATDTLNRFIQ